MRLNGRIILTVFLASICPHDLRGLSLLQRVGDGHVRLSAPQFSKDAAQTKFADCHWFKQQFCECRSKPFPMLVRRGQCSKTSYDLHQQLVAKNPSREEAQWHLFGGFALVVWNALSATAHQVQKYSSPIHKAHCL